MNSDADQIIINFINQNPNVGYLEIQNEINNVLDNILPELCYVPYSNLNNYYIDGFSNNNTVLNFSYLIPNLFRKCYMANTLLIPNICPTFVYNSRTFEFIPVLIDENLIKSFLYFNFPCNIHDYDPSNNFLKNIVDLSYNIDKKKETQLMVLIVQDLIYIHKYILKILY